MENNKLIKQNNNFLSKLLNKIKVFIFNNKKVKEVKEEENLIIKNNFLEELKVEVINNKSLQDEFSLEKLRKIRIHFQDAVNRKKQTLIKIQK